MMVVKTTAYSVAVLRWRNALGYAAPYSSMAEEKPHLSLKELSYQLKQ